MSNSESQLVLPTAINKSFEMDVYPVEIATIKARRSSANSERPEPSKIDRPSVTQNLIGLAFSGGGIRSATFNLGLVQALHRRGILRHVDYLSTVSGGGFIGSALSALMRKQGAQFPFPHSEREGEPPALSHLRNHSNYLAPRGFIDFARVAAVLFRGVLLNGLAILPYPFALALLISMIHGAHLRGLAGQSGASLLIAAPQIWFTPWVMALGILCVILYPVAGLFYRRHLYLEQERGSRLQAAFYWRDRFDRFYAVLLIAVFAVAFVDIQPIVIHFSHGLYMANAAWKGYLGGSITLGLLITSRAGALVKTNARMIALLIAGIVGPLVLFLIYIFFANLLIYFADVRSIAGIRLIIPLPYILCGMALVIILGGLLILDVNSTSMHVFYRDRLSRAYLVGIDERGDIEPEDDLSFRDTCQPGSTVPYHLINTTLNLQGIQEAGLRGRMSDFFVFSKHFIGSERTGYCRTEQMERRFPWVHLSSAMAVSGAAASPNMGTYTTRSLMLLMALLNVRLGYWMPNPNHIRTLDEQDKKNGRRLPRLPWRPGPVQFFRELVGALDATGPAINVSDGGHLENLGVYELLRRRCRFIIVGDGGADPSSHCDSLATLMRFARIDLGIEIDIRLDDLRTRGERLARQHCALGTICYPARDGQPCETGYLLYVKSSVTGDEDEVVTEYHAEHPDFPHESTADQFFDEGQFEAYRSLGYHAVDTLFDELPAGAPEQSLTFTMLECWFDSLAARLTPRLVDESVRDRLQKSLAAVEQQLQDPLLSGYFFEVYPELRLPPADSAAVPDARADRVIFHVVQMQLQLMERVAEALELQQAYHRNHVANKGWMSTFSRWTAAPSFKRLFPVAATSCGVDFLQFCLDRWGLRAKHEAALTPGGVQ